MEPSLIAGWIYFGPSDGTHSLGRDDRRHQSLAYVTNRVDDTVSVIETANNTVVDTITVGGDCTGVATTPDGTRAYVANLARFSSHYDAFIYTWRIALSYWLGCCQEDTHLLRCDIFAFSQFRVCSLHQPDLDPERAIRSRPASPSIELGVPGTTRSPTAKRRLAHSKCCIPKLVGALGAERPFQAGQGASQLRLIVCCVFCMHT
jgi:YVTN family beta-propeller protein